MDLKRSVAVWVLVFALSLSLVGANLVTAGERTVLDPGFVKGSLDEEGVYDEVRMAAMESMGGNLSTGEELGLPIDTEEVLNESLTESYLRGEAERNVDRFYAYLHGDREDLVLAIDLSPVRENVRDTVRSDVEDAGLAELLEASGGDLGNGQGVSVDPSVVRGMADSEENFTRSRKDFRGDIEDAVLEEMVDEAFAAASDDELLALVIEGYDSEEYTAAEKEGMVAEREAEIRDALRDEIEADRGDEVEAAVENRMSEVRSALLADLEGSVGGEDLPGNVSGPLRDLMEAYVDGLTTDVSYGSFRSEVEDARTRLGDGVAAAVDDALAEDLPDRVDLTEEMGAEEERALEEARSTVATIDVLFLVLPIAALLLIGAVYAVSRSLVVTGFGAGSGLVVAGGSGYVSATVGESQLRRMLAEAGPGDVVSDIALTLAERMLDVLATQSLVLALAGAILMVAAAVAWRKRGAG